jgi:hypothetical protein
VYMVCLISYNGVVFEIFCQDNLLATSPVQTRMVGSLVSPRARFSDSSTLFCVSSACFLVHVTALLFLEVIGFSLFSWLPHPVFY